MEIQQPNPHHLHFLSTQKGKLSLEIAAWSTKQKQLVLHPFRLESSWGCGGKVRSISPKFWPSKLTSWGEVQKSCSSWVIFGIGFPNPKLPFKKFSSIALFRCPASSRWLRMLITWIALAHRSQFKHKRLRCKSCNKQTPLKHVVLYLAP